MILNLTQHRATQDQEGVVELPVEQRIELLKLLTFVRLPTSREVDIRAAAIAEIAAEFFGQPGERVEGASCMIGGAPYLMGPLAEELHNRGITPVFAFSERVSSETPAADGTVIKSSVFKHIGWVRG